jgi:pimeloyl-ACP methyl ester carboxylesterase
MAWKKGTAASVPAPQTSEDRVVDIFQEWRSRAESLQWRSSTPANHGREVEIFHRRSGTPGARGLVCVHGFPTSSIDFFALTRELGSEFEIFVLDFPGFGLSEKPPSPYIYSLYDDARLLLHMIGDIWRLSQYTLLTHDRGTSVGLVALHMIAEDGGAVAPGEAVLTNANIFLPLANLTPFQKALLDPSTARSAAAEVTPEALAAGMGAFTFLPRRTLGDPEIAAIAKCLAHNSGVQVLPDTIQYLNERSRDETKWLKTLSHLPVGTSLVWGLHDNVSPLRVANFVWEAFLKEKPGRNRYWIVPSADHYLQCDAPKELAEIIRLTVKGDDLPLQTLGARSDGPVLVDQTR